MNRKLKFKARDLGMDEWLDGNVELAAIWNKSPGTLRMSLTIKELNQVLGKQKKGAIDVVFLQYMGRGDINGEEIFEGDVCNVLENGSSEWTHGVVYRDGPTFYVNDCPASDIDQFEVVGNVFDNKDFAEKFSHFVKLLSK